MSSLPDAMVNKNTTFHGNPLLKGARETVALTKEHIEEIKKCANDPVYFAENYMHILNVDTGKQLIKLRDYQKRILRELHKNRYNIVLSCRQSGKCVTYESYITLRHKNYNNGEPFSIPIGVFYEWQKFIQEHKKIIHENLQEL